MVADSPLLLGLLLVIAAAAGWFVARLTRPGAKPRRSTVPPADFYRGLDYVLSDDSDKALVLLQSMAQADSGLIEIHFALGTLFRQRGETDRAIRVHQDLLARPDLAKRHHDQALFALAEDYLKAGLFDRAEALFAQLADEGVRRPDSLQRLVSIYERQRDWSQAIDARGNLANLIPGDHDKIIAHYFCELAQQAHNKNDLVQMRKDLKEANRSSRGVVRGALMRADLAALTNDLPLALRLYKRVLETAPGMASVVLQRLHACFDPAAPEIGRELREALRRQPDLNDHLARAALANNLVQNDAVQDATRQFIAGNTALRLLSENYEDNYAELTAMLHSLGLARSLFRCTQCGYSATDLFWQCPGCQSWETGHSDIRLSANSHPAV